MRQTLRWVTAAGVLCWAAGASAQSSPIQLVYVIGNPTTDSALATQTELLTASLTKQLDQVIHLSTIIQNTRQAVRVGNEMVSIGRTAFKVYNTLRNYTIEDYLRDAHRGLVRAMPELGGLEEELDTARGNMDALGSGFWQMHNRLDRETEAKLMRLALQASSASLISQDFGKTGVREPVSLVDSLVAARMRRQGMSGKRAMEAASEGARTKKIADLVREVEGKNRADLSLAAANAEVAGQTMVNTTAMRQMMEAAAAEEEAQRIRVQEEDEKARKSLSDIAEGLDQIGTVH